MKAVADWAINRFHEFDEEPPVVFLHHIVYRLFVITTDVLEKKSNQYCALYASWKEIKP
jgi:hypothetical protein